METAAAGPSRSNFSFPALATADYHFAGPVGSSSRSSTPRSSSVRPRSRSVSVFSRSGSRAGDDERRRWDAAEARRREEKLKKERLEKAQRLRSTWDLLLEKYGRFLPEEDDEVDILTGRVTKDRGHVRSLRTYDFGDISLSEPEPVENNVGGPESAAFDSDEDELGDWGDRSGLDLQVSPVKDLRRRVWTVEDEDDLQAFMRAESGRKDLDDSDEEVGRHEAEGERSSSDSERFFSDGDDSTEDQSARLVRSTVAPRLEDLFPAFESRGDQSSDDELADKSGFDHEATAVYPAKVRI